MRVFIKTTRFSTTKMQWKKPSATANACTKFLATLHSQCMTSIDARRVTRLIVMLYVSTASKRAMLAMMLNSFVMTGN